MSTDNQTSINQPNTSVNNVIQGQVSYKEDQPIQYEYPSEKIGNKFNVSVASLGDIYTFPKETKEQYDVLLEEGSDSLGKLWSKKRDPNTGRPSSSTIMKQKGKVNNVFLNPYSIQTKPNEQALKKSRVIDVNYLHMTTLPESKKYIHVPNGIINPPKSTFSVKTIIETNLKNHEEEMRPTVLYPNRVRINIVQPQRRTLNQSLTRTEGNQGKDPLMVIGKKVDANKDQHSDDHVKFTQSREVVYKPRALSSNKARKTLLVSEKFVGAVQDYFRSSEMKIPARNSINEIASYAKNVEKTLNKFASDIEKRKPATSSGKYEDPFRKKLRKDKVIKPNPPKIYPIIDNDYQKNVEEKLAKLQIELRQIFDTLSQQGCVEQGDDDKVKGMITKAKELTNLISHLANDVKKSRELHFKQKKERAEEKNKINASNIKQIPLSSLVPTEQKTIVEVSNAKINQSIQMDNLNNSTLPNTQPQLTESQINQLPHQQSKPNLSYLNPNMKGYNNNILISAINPVQESMIKTISNNNSFIKTQSMNKQTNVSFTNTIKEEQQDKYSNERSMTLPNYNATMPQFPGEQKTQGNNSQIQFNPLFSYSKNNNNPLYTSTSSNDPNITLNNYRVEATKIILDTKHPILDDRFSAFSIEMPAQYYFEVSKDREPNKEKEWFVRPHHTETFTPNENAIPDDLLNTKYISYYGPIEKKETKTRQQLLEEMIAETRSNIDQLQYDIFTKSQFDKEKEQLYARLEKLKEEAKKDYVPGQFLDKNDKKNEKITALLQSGEPKTFSEMFEGNEQIHQTNFAIDTFAKLRSEMRNKEQQILIQKRKEEYERIRPPIKNWYELKGAEFQKEMQRNKMVINAGPEYFEKIKQLTNTDLY